MTFFKKPAFLQFCIIFEKIEQECRHYWNDSSQNYGFYNTYAACAGMLKTLLAVDEKTLFCAFTGGRMKPETREDEGLERCWVVEQIGDALLNKKTGNSEDKNKGLVWDGN